LEDTLSDTATFDQLGLSPELLAALAREKHLVPTPIQAGAIPILLQGRDLLGIAQTGTGKTAAFVLPILQQLRATKSALVARSCRALVLAPTRELAIQIAERARAYADGQPVRVAVIFGGVSQFSQVQAMARGVDILVATPGRLLDLMGQQLVRLDQVRFLVLDEADRMLDMGFIRDVRKIMAVVPKDRQSLLFSATMPTEIASLAAEWLRTPQRVEVTPQVITVDKIDQRVHFLDTGAKRHALLTLLAAPEMRRVIVFTRTKHGANRVAEALEQADVSSAALHGNKSQNARQRALADFASGEVRVLVATDIAARGIDVPGITHVVNFELPNEPESYVHRIGRTARAGAAGIAISFCAPDEQLYLRQIEKLIRRPITVAEGRPVANEPPPAASRPAGGRFRSSGRPQATSGAARRPGQPGGASPQRRHGAPARGRG
jgi:ATP-dependent RNA helicase RhlE